MVATAAAGDHRVHNPNATLDKVAASELRNLSSPQSTAGGASRS
jgi:hypothetical protein